MALDNTKLTGKVSKILIDMITSHVTEHTDNLLKTIAQDNDLDYDMLKQKYGNVAPQIEIGKTKKKQSANGNKEPSEPKKRGRKKKHKEELVETEEYEYNGVTYLVDNDNNVYTYNTEAPTLIGTKLIDGRVKMLQAL